MSFLNPLYNLIARLVALLHDVVHPVLRSEGASWAVAIVLLVVAMRLLLFPLFVKQIKTQRQMQVLAPQLKALQQKYKGDRETLAQEQMKLYREHGANPVAGCLPLILQIPIFLALFRVLNGIQPKSCAPGPACEGGYHFVAAHGLSVATVMSASTAKIFGVPIAAAFTSKASLLSFLSASQTSVRVLAAAMIVLMALSTFITQRQLLAKNAATADSPMASQQKTLLYILPLMFAFFGFRFPVGVLLYWLTTNLWSMGQQYFVIKRMPVAGGPSVITAPASPAEGSGGAAASGGSAGTAAGRPPRGDRPTGGLLARLRAASGGAATGSPPAAPPPVGLGKGAITRAASRGTAPGAAAAGAGRSSDATNKAAEVEDVPASGSGRVDAARGPESALPAAGTQRPGGRAGSATTARRPSGSRSRKKSKGRNGRR